MEKFLKKTLLIIFFVTPFIGLYFFLFLLSMDTAPDREEYLRMMQYPFSGREEIGISVYSYLLGFFIENPILKLIFFQLLSLFLLYCTLIFQAKSNSLLRVLLTIFFSLILFSVMFGIQLRVGFASVLLVFISLGLNKEPKFSNLIWYLLPCFFHVAVIPLVLFLFLFYYLNVRELKRFQYFYFLFFVILFLCSYFLRDIILFLGMNPYYLDYLEDKGLYNMRALPLSFVLYFIALLFVFKNINKFNLDYKFWMLPIGIMFSFIALILDLPFFHKFMAVFFLYSMVYLILVVDFSKTQEKYYIFLIYFLMPLGFLYFAKNVFLF